MLSTSLGMCHPSASSRSRPVTPALARAGERPVVRQDAFQGEGAGRAGGNGRRTGQGPAQPLPIEPGAAPAISQFQGALCMQDGTGPCEGQFQALDLQPDSRILLFSTEGDTDPVMYRKIVWGF